MKRYLLVLLFLSVLCLRNGAFAQNGAIYDTIDFETPTSKIIIDTAQDNVWQIGTADKAFLNIGHMGDNSIVTDTINPYPANNTSSFIYVIRNPYTVGCQTMMQFWHKYDMDSMDYGEIEASYDGGNSWVTVADTNLNDPYYSYFYWEMDFHESDQSYSWHNLRITGTSDGWIKSTFLWNWFTAVDRDTIIPNPDSLMIKFTFHSDDIFDNKEGWMIDQIWVEALVGSQFCSSAKNIELEGNLVVIPNPVTSDATLQLKKSLKNGILSLYNTFGQEVYTQSNITGTEVYFSRTNLQAGIYILRVVDEGQFRASKRIIISD